MDAAEIVSELLKTYAHPRGPIGRMQECEQEQGHRAIKWGANRPIHFRKTEWYDGVITEGADGKTIRIIAIAARRPGAGAFKRMLAEIRERGFTPVVVAPMGPSMPNLLRRWGWRGEIVGEGPMARDEWKPTDNVA